jgi:hypothetical protein
MAHSKMLSPRRASGDLKMKTPIKSRLIATWIFLITAISFMVLQVRSQTEEALEGQLEIEAVEELRERTSQDATLTEEASARISALYDTAISALENAERAKAQVVAYENEQADTANRVEALKAKLSEPREEPSFSVEEGTTAGHVEGLLTQERS